MGSPCSSQHVGKAEVLLVTVPRPRVGREESCGLEVPYEPQDHKAVGPVGKERSPGHRLFFPALGMGGTEELFALTNGNFNAGPHCIPPDDLMGWGAKISVQEYGIGVCPGEIMAQREAERLVTHCVVPDGGECIDPSGLCLWPRIRGHLVPLEGSVLKQSGQRRHSATLLAGPPAMGDGRLLWKFVQRRPHANSPSNLRAWGTSIDDCFARVALVHDHPKQLGVVHPGTGKLNQFHGQLWLCLVGHSLGFVLGPGRPPESGGVGQTKDTVGDTIEPDCKTDDDEADTVAFTVPFSKSRSVMLPSCTGDCSAAVLVEGVIHYDVDLCTLKGQNFRHELKQCMGDHVCNPASPGNKPVHTGKIPGFMEPHSQIDPTDGMPSDGQDPSDHQRHEEPKARRAETVSERKFGSSRNRVPSIDK